MLQYLFRPFNSRNYASLGPCVAHPSSQDHNLKALHDWSRSDSGFEGIGPRVQKALAFQALPSRVKGGGFTCCAGVLVSAGSLGWTWAIWADFLAMLAPPYANMGPCWAKAEGLRGSGDAYSGLPSDRLELRKGKGFVTG